MDILELEPKVRAIARSIHRRVPLSVCLEDLIQEGWVGALKARQHFDESRGVPFRLYATRRIQGEILDYLRKSDILSRDHRQSVSSGAELVFSLELRRQSAQFARDGGQHAAVAKVMTERLMPPCSEQAKCVLYHHYAMGRSHREISGLLGIRQTSVASILRVNLNRMRSAAGVPIR